MYLLAKEVDSFQQTPASANSNKMPDILWLPFHSLQLSFLPLVANSKLKPGKKRAPAGNATMMRCFIILPVLRHFHL
jgi:hypothetical protein